MEIEETIIFKPTQLEVVLRLHGDFRERLTPRKVRRYKPACSCFSIVMQRQK